MFQLVILFIPVYVKPWINCPIDVTMILDPNANTADVSALLEKPKSNVKDVKMFPEKYRTSLVFPAGNTKITFVATNGNGIKAQCDADIIIEGIVLLIDDRVVKSDY